MALNVTKSNEVIEVETLCFTIYSQPGLGKTSLSFTASRPLMLDFDQGAHRAANRRDVARVCDWSDVASIAPDDIADYDTIIVDTVGKALDCLSADIIKNNSRLAYGGALNQQGWGQLGVRFSAFLKRIRSFGKDIILIAHMDEKHDGDAIKERLKIQGGTKDLVLTDSDVIARISVHNKSRHLIFSPTETSFGKDPAQLVSVELPDAGKAQYQTCLADILGKIKGTLNEMTQEQMEAHSEHQWFVDHLPTVLDADGINQLLGRSKRAGREVQKMLVDRAAQLGLEFDPDQRKYVYLEEFHPDQDANDEQDASEEAA